MSERFLTVRELAKRWKLSDKRIYQLKEEIGYTQIGGAIRFPIEKIEAYEQTRTIEPDEKEEITT